MIKLNITPAQRAEYTILAKLAREQKKLECVNIRTDYIDADHWRSLASKFGVRLPIAYYPASDTKYVKRAATKVGVDISEFIFSTGCTTLKELVSLNPNWSALAFIGLYLEFANESLQAP